MRSSRRILIIHSENAFADSRLPLIPAEASSVCVFDECLFALLLVTAYESDRAT